MTPHTIDSLFARLRSLVATLPPDQAMEASQLFVDLSQFNQYEVDQLITVVQKLQDHAKKQKRELAMWRQAEADWWNSRVSRETALFEDRLEMVQPTLGDEMMERLA